MDNPIISVYMTTYYHEEYIRQSIDSVLSQDVDVPYEIIISDDCSRDDTPNILLEYQRKYSQITVNINKENVGLTKNVFLAKTMCHGRYIVGISGDDYWIDHKKLQKQYDFLKNNPEYVGVATQMEIRVDDNTKAFRVTPPKKDTNRKFTLTMFLKGLDFPLNGLMQRNMTITQEGKEYFGLMPKISPYIDDLTDCILLLKRGDIYILDGATNVYRVRGGNKDKHNFNQSNSGNLWYERHVDMLNELNALFGEELDLSTRYAMVCAVGFTHAIYYHKLKEYVSVYNSMPSKKVLIGIKSVRYIIEKFLQVFLDRMRGR